MNRRDFLHRGSAVTGALLLSPAAASAASPSSTGTASATAAATPIAPTTAPTTAPAARVRSLLNGATDAQQWQTRRAELAATIDRYLGQREPIDAPPSRLRILEESTLDDCRKLKLAYEVEAGEEVRAWLLIPPPSRRRSGAAVLCLHGTSPEAKDSQLGAGDKPGRDYARFLACHGFITLSPDHCCSGERLVEGFEPYDSAPFYRRHPDWSMVGKAIWDGRRALDILAQVPEADPSRFGCVGHSLGGHGAMFVAAFDDRVRAAVSSCGLTTWDRNPLRTKWSRREWYVYFPHLRPFMENPGAQTPFDLPDFAALIAPRAFLNISGMTDKTYGNNETLPQAGLEIQRVYDLLGGSDQFSNFLFGADHNVPRYSRTLTLGWLETFLIS